ncbi:UNVERIFIED_CONTAM: hypothetical protein PYX00_004889 [Menopon gallinae]|uniref:CUE domain-containing protein n=1 Tax=Menopon gallinae TaxID=328185 RepID=A0AAW2I6Z4_9NEOP
MVVIKELFSENRFPSGWKIIPLISYLPLGLVLATLRFFIGLQAIIAASLLHKLSSFRSVVLRTMFAILGVFIFEENQQSRDESVKVIVTNNVSILDHLVIHLLTGSISISVWDVPSFLHFAFNYKNLGSLKEKELLIQNVKRSIDSGITVDVQPENGITSGQKGLLRFLTWPCELSHPVQPVSIKVWRPQLMEIKPSVISASWSTDLFWFLFVPFTVFTIKYLPVVQQSENESTEEMSKRVESSISKELKISQTNFTSADKAEYEKRLETERAAPKPAPTYSSVDQKLMDAAWRVKEVLPDVPVKTICAELAKNRNVDATIASFLEGLVQYVPEQSPGPFRENRNTIPEKSKSSLEMSQPSTSLDVSAKTFPKSARDRMISFQERKMRLIASARQRYIEKHALNIMNSSCLF